MAATLTSPETGDYPPLKGYPEKKTRANGAIDTVYVQPFHVDVLDADGVIKKRQLRKVQSDPYDPSKVREIQRAVQQATLRAAERIAVARDAITTHREGLGRRRLPRTLREAAAEAHATSIRFDASGKPRDLKGGTTTKYAKHMKNLANANYDPPLADVPFEMITGGDVRLHFKAYSEDHLAGGTNKYRSYLNQIGGYAAKCGYWKKNLFEDLPFVSVPESDAEDNLALSLVEITELNRQARKCGNPRLPAYLRLLRVGLRASEVLALTADDVDEENRIVYVRYSLVQGKPKWAEAQGRAAVAYLEETKTRESRRKVRIHSEFMKDLMASLSVAKPCAIPAYNDKGQTKEYRFVIPNKQGHVWLYNNALRMVRADVYLKAKIDLRKYEAEEGQSKQNARWNHIWRNTYAADLVALNADDSQLAQLMRHSDVNLSKRRYASVRLEFRDAYRTFADKIKEISDFNWQIGEIDIDVDENERSRFTTKQMTLKEAVRPRVNAPAVLEDLFK